MTAAAGGVLAAAGGVLAALTEVGFFVDGGWFDRALLVSVGCDVTEGLLVTDVVTVVVGCDVNAVVAVFLVSDVVTSCCDVPSESASLGLAVVRGDGDV